MNVLLKQSLNETVALNRGLTLNQSRINPAHCLTCTKPNSFRVNNYGCESLHIAHSNFERLATNHEECWACFNAICPEFKMKETACLFDNDCMYKYLYIIIHIFHDSFFFLFKIFLLFYLYLVYLFYSCIFIAIRAE